MPDWALSLLISVGVTATGVGVAWGVLSERVANLKDEVKTKASAEALGHLEKSLDEIKAMLKELIARESAR